ncbi:MAG: HDOD domain-containing protein [Desulfobacterota bacterium]|nr:HDOD domain-containing protein [Thermodesulfobacteriota bacterium]
MSEVDQVLQSIERLPPFPAVVFRALQLLEDPRTSAQDLVDVLHLDPAITANVLRLCNSAYFGLKKKVHSLKEAIILVGFQPLLEIILSQQSIGLLKKPCQGYDLGQVDLWKHSVACALLTRIISKRLDWQMTYVPFTAALLHDIGKMILGQFFQGHFMEIKRLVHEEGFSFTEAEREVLGIDHAELGGKVAEYWKFPGIMISAIRFHHTPAQSFGDSEMVELIRLCDMIALMTGIGVGADGLAYRGDDGLLRRHHLRSREVESFIVQLEEQFRLVNETLNVN